VKANAMSVNKRYSLATCSTLIWLAVFSAISSAQDTLPSLVKRIEPAVVQIITYDHRGEKRGQGSGFFVSAQGEILTNRHVLERAFEAQVKTADGKMYAIKSIVGEDQDADLLKFTIDAAAPALPYLPVIAIPPEKGERVMTVGSPLGLEQTLSDGIVAAIRDIPGSGKVIQITAPISPGSSGSPVVNMRGEVIGVAAFYLVKGQNLNFAIPGERIAAMEVFPTALSLLAWREGWSEERRSADALYATGQSFLLAEDYDKALPYFEKVVIKEPDHWRAWSKLGFCKRKNGFNWGAIDAFKQVIRIKPDYTLAYQILAVTYIDVGRPQDAIEVLKQAIRFRPDDIRARYLLGMAYRRLALSQEATDAFNMAVRIKPTDAEGYYTQGVVYVTLDRPREAIEALTQAIRLKPGHAEAHSALGLMYLRVGDRDAAMEHYRILRTLNPKMAQEILDLGHR
jgi:serine protease Do